MTQQHLQPPLHYRGKLDAALSDANIRDAESVISVLDNALPLQGASHADVVEYVVEIPLSYAQCFALLTDGRKVALQNSRTFVGWSTHDRSRSLLFHCDGTYYEVAVEAGLRGQSPGCIRTVSIEAASDHRSSLARKFIGIDGAVLVQPTPLATN